MITRTLHRCKVFPDRRLPGAAPSPAARRLLAGLERRGYLVTELSGHVLVSPRRGLTEADLFSMRAFAFEVRDLLRARDEA